MLVAGAARAFWREPSRGIEELDPAGARARWRRGSAPLLCHAPGVARRLGAAVAPPAFDILELWAFVRPARFCVPTPRGLAQALGLEEPRDPVGQLPLLRRAAEGLLAELAGLTGRRRDAALPAAAAMAAEGWIWGARGGRGARPRCGRRGLARRLVGAGGVAGGAPAPRLRSPPGERGRDARAPGRAAAGRRRGPAPSRRTTPPRSRPPSRPGNGRASPARWSPKPARVSARPWAISAPDGLWLAENGGAVWISTFTRNLQRQVDRELDRQYPERAAKSAARGGCARGARTICACSTSPRPVGGRSPHEAVVPGPCRALDRGHPRRRHERRRFPGLAGRAVRRRPLARAGRPARRMRPRRLPSVPALLRRTLHTPRPARRSVWSPTTPWCCCRPRSATTRARPIRSPRATSSTKATTCSMPPIRCSPPISRDAEGAELRRWLLGSEDRRGRARGLARRLDDLPDEHCGTSSGPCLEAARCLPGQGWHRRLGRGRPPGSRRALPRAGQGAASGRAHRPDSEYGLECPKEPVLEGLLDRAAELERALEVLTRPLAALRRELLATLDREADRLESAARLRMEAVTRGIERRGLLQLGAWRAMLAELGRDTPEDFVDLFALERRRGVEVDVGMHRHWKDPGLPFAREVASKAHGLVVTSATLRDSASTGEEGWATAHMRTGLRHLVSPPAEFEVALPLRLRGAHPDPGARRRPTRTTPPRPRPPCASCSWRRAAGRSACSRPSPACARSTGASPRRWNAPAWRLYAQHVDAMDTGTLVDVFRAERDACLLGTDAVRDGIDVPGRSLRLVVFDGCRGPVPTSCIGRAGASSGGSRYDDMLARLRLRQAFGRLVRPRRRPRRLRHAGLLPCPPGSPRPSRPRCPSSAWAWPGPSTACAAICGDLA